jgi:hypothetical protein
VVCSRMVPSLSLTTTSTWMSTSHHRSQEERTLTWISPSRIKAPSTSQTSHRALLSQLPVNDGSTIPNSRGGLLSMKTLSSTEHLHNIMSADDHDAGGVVRPTARAHAFRSARQATFVDEISRPHRQSEPDINGSNS